MEVQAAVARKKEIDRDRILDAVDAVILESGGRQLTLDAVVERAGISKGGLVYSFPTKDALIAAALKREMARFQAAVGDRMETHPHDRNREFLGYIEQMLAEDDLLTRKAAFLMTALIHAPEMAEAVRQHYRDLFDLFDPDTPDGREVQQAVLAAEGLFLLRGLGWVDVPIEECRSILRHAYDVIAKKHS